MAICRRTASFQAQVVKVVAKTLMNVGDRVRVKESVVVYHHPQHRNEAFDIHGLEGEIAAFVNEWEGKTISANFPILVKFEGKFKAHLRETEVEVI